MSGRTRGVRQLWWGMFDLNNLVQETTLYSVFSPTLFKMNLYPAFNEKNHAPDIFDQEAVVEITEESEKQESVRTRDQRNPWISWRALALTLITFAGVLIIEALFTGVN